jgi:putative sporulation protein YyaC
MMVGGICLPFSLKLGLARNDHPLKVPYSDSDAADIISRRLTEYFAEALTNREIVIMCIGTDRSTGDALGPIVGSRLLQLGFDERHLFGTLNHPVHAMNLIDVIEQIRQQYHHPFIVAVDACLGQSSSVGHIQVGIGPVKPGAGVNKDLPPVGDIHLTGIVNVGGFMEYFVLQNTRLSIVFNMAEVIAESLYHAYRLTREAPATIAKLD